MFERDAVCVNKWSLAKSRNVSTELCKDYAFLEPEILKTDFIYWISGSKFMEKNSRIIEHNAVCFEKFSSAKSRNVSEELCKILPSQISTNDFLVPVPVIVWI